MMNLVAKKMFHLVAVIAPSLCLVSCVSLNNPVPHPALPALPALTSADAADWMPLSASLDSVHSAFLQAWWNGFDDPVLSAYQNELIKENLSLQQAEHAYQQARAIAEAAPKALLPTLSVGLSGSQSKKSDSRPSLSSSLVASSRWEIDLWGKIRSRYAMTLEEVSIQRAARVGVKVSLQRALAEAIINIRATDRQIELYQAIEHLSFSIVKALRARVNAGVLAEANVFNAEKSLSDIKRVQQGLVAQRKQWEAAVAALLSRPVHSVHVPVAASWLHLPEMPPQFPSKVLQQRWDIQQAASRVYQANAELGVARAAYFPSLVFDVSMGQQGGWGKWLSAPQYIWSLGPSLALALLDSGQKDLASKQAKIGYETTVLAYRQTVLDAFNEVESSLIESHRLREQQNTHRNAFEWVKKERLDAERRYQAGVVDNTVVLEALLTERYEQLNALELDRQRLMAYVEWVSALGGASDASFFSEMSQP